MSYVAGRPWQIGHLRGLDGLRGVAILLVLAQHWGVPGFPGSAAPGVTVFFVLSGFLITSLLVREHRRTGRISFRRFYLSRAARLLPALLTLLAVVTAVDVASGSPAHIAQRVLPALLYGYNWLCAAHAPVGDPLGQVWSLSIEEQFYLLWPVVLLMALKRGGTRAAFQVAVVGCILSTIDRLSLALLTPATVERVYFGTDTNLIPIMAGCALALAAADGRVPRVGPRVALLASACLALICTTGIYGRNAVFLIVVPTGITVVAVILVTYVLANPVVAVLRCRPLVWAGALSYSLYLWQTPFTIVAAAHPGSLSKPLAIAVTILTATASYLLVERPLIALRRRVGLVGAALGSQHVAGPPGVTQGSPKTAAKPGDVVQKRRQPATGCVMDGGDGVGIVALDWLDAEKKGESRPAGCRLPGVARARPAHRAADTPI